MTPILRISLVVVSFLFLALVVTSVRRDKLSLSHSFIWIAFALIALIMALFPDFVFILAVAFGFKEGSNFVFFVVLVALCVYIFYLSKLLSKQSKQITRLIQESALLSDELEKQAVDEQGEKSV